MSSHRTQDDPRGDPGHAAQAGGPATRLQARLWFRCRPLLGLWFQATSRRKSPARIVLLADATARSCGQTHGKRQTTGVVRHVERKEHDPDDRSYISGTQHEQVERPFGTLDENTPGWGRFLPEPAGAGACLVGPGPPTPEAGERGMVRGPPLECAGRVALVAGVRVAARNGNQGPRPCLLGSLRLCPGIVLEERYERLDAGCREATRV